MDQIMRLSYLIVFLIVTANHLACAASNNRLSPEVETILEKADSIELLSLSPEHLKDPPKDAFHRWPVLGQTTLKGADKASAVTALKAGISANKGMVAGCFNPRHGIRVTRAGKTIDLVICFECMSLQVYEGDKRLPGVLTTADAQPLFNKLLATANIPIPKE